MWKSVPSFQRAGSGYETAVRSPGLGSEHHHLLTHLLVCVVFSSYDSFRQWLGVALTCSDPLVSDYSSEVPELVSMHHHGLSDSFFCGMVVRVAIIFRSGEKDLPFRIDLRVMEILARCTQLLPMEFRTT